MELILAPSWSSEVVLPPYYQPQLSYFFAINKSFDFYLSPIKLKVCRDKCVNSILVSADSYQDDKLERILEIDLEKGSFTYSLCNYGDWTDLDTQFGLECILTSLQSGEALVVPSSYVISFQPDSASALDTEPYCLIRGQDYYIGKRPEYFYQHIRDIEV